MNGSDADDPNGVVRDVNERDREELVDGRRAPAVRGLAEGVTRHEPKDDIL